MIDKTQQPADKQLSELYQQRKAKHPMPDEIRQNVLSSVKNNQKKSHWFAPPVWSATFAAIFVVVISIQFFPNTPEQMPAERFNEDVMQTASTPTDYEYAEPLAQTTEPQIESYEASSARYKVKAANSPKPSVFTTNQATTAVSELEVVADTQNLETASIVSDIALMSPNEEVEPSSSSDLMLKDSQNAISGASAPMAESAPSVYSYSKAKQRAEKAFVADFTVVYGRFKPANSTDENPSITDCANKTHILDSNLTIDIPAQQWLGVYYDENQKIIKIERLDDFKGCDNANP